MHDDLDSRDSLRPGFASLSPASLLRKGPWHSHALLPSWQSNSAVAADAGAAVHQELTSQSEPNVPEVALPSHDDDASCMESDHPTIMDARAFGPTSHNPLIEAQLRQGASLSAPAALTVAQMTANMHSGGAGHIAEPARPSKRHSLQECLRTPPQPLTHVLPHPLEPPHRVNDHACLSLPRNSASLSQPVAVQHGRPAQLPWHAAMATAAPHSSRSFRTNYDMMAGYQSSGRVPHNRQWLVECAPAPRRQSAGPARQRMKDGGACLASGCGHSLNWPRLLPGTPCSSCRSVFPCDCCCCCRPHA